MLPNLHIFCLLRFCTLQGMRVLSIFPNSPAEAAGLVPNKAAGEQMFDESFEFKYVIYR